MGGFKKKCGDSRLAHDQSKSIAMPTARPIENVSSGRKEEKMMEKDEC